MKNAKTGMQLLLLFGMAVGWTQNAWAYYTETVDGIRWSYTVSAGAAELFGPGPGYGCTSAIPQSTTGALSIPCSLGGYPVRSIGQYAFGGCNGLTSVTIPPSVTSIGPEAFEHCAGLMSVTIPDSVTNIEGKAFAECFSLTTVAIPTGVTRIAGHLFEGCRSLTNVTIPDGVTRIGENAFYYCTALPTVTLPSSVLDIAASAFEGCSGLTSLTIPNSVLDIRACAFYGCSNLTSLTIPSSVTGIGQFAFSGCSGLTELYVPAGWEGTGMLDRAGIPAGCTVVYSVWPASPLTWSYSISEGKATVTGVEPATGDVVVPDTLDGYPVTGIGARAFNDCTGLTSVTIPASVTNIGYWSSYSMINSYGCAFSGCSGLTDIHVAEGNPVYSSRDGVLFTKDGKTLLFCPDGKTGSYSVPDGVLQIGDGEVYYGHFRQDSGWFAFAGCTNLTRVIIPDSVKAIDDGSFEHCGGLTSIEIPDSVTSIGISAFGNCNGLAMISIGRSVMSIGEEAFWGCNSLTAVHIHDLAAWCKISFDVSGGNPLGYAHRLFLDGEEVTNLEIPAGVTSIGDYAFKDCTGLTSSTIPGSVTEIGWMAFAGCTALKTLYVPASWQGTSMLDYVGVPEGCTVVYGVPPESVLRLAGDNRTFTATAANRITLGVTANVSWIAQSSASWLTVDTTSGNGNGSITYNVADNTGMGSRTGTITVSGGGLSRTFTVTQEGVTGEQKLVFDANGGYCDTGYDFYRMGQTYGYLPKATWSDHDFLGWFTEANGGVQVTASDIATTASERTLYAHWSSASGAVAWEYTISGGQAVVTGAHPAEGDLVIPSSLGGWPVTGIEAYAFDGCMGLAGVTIPDSVTNIGAAAFIDCMGLTSLTIGNGVKSLWDEAFHNCSALASVALPASVTIIGDAAFSGCTSLKSFSVASGNPAFKAVSGLLLSKDGKTLMCGVNGDVAIPSGVTAIGDTAFQQCYGLTGVAIPNTVTRIGAGAFYGCDALSSVTLPSSVTSVGNWAFFNCDGLKTLYVPESWEGTDMLAEAEVPEGCRVVYGSGSPQAQLALAATSRSFTAAAASGQQLAVTANVAWTANSSKSWLTVTTASGNGNGSIIYNVSANTGTSSRTGTITVTGGGLTRTFTVTQEGQTGEQKLVFDANGGYCDTGYDFYRMGQSYGYLPKATWSDHDFLGWFTEANGGVQVTASDIATTASERTLYAHWSSISGDVAWEYTISDGQAVVTGAHPAEGDLVIPSSLGGCPVTVIGAATSEGDGAFEMCTGLTSVTIPSSVTFIGYRAFIYCSGLVSVSIPDSVTAIGPEAFDGCIALTSLTIPASVTSIGDTAFDGCIGLETLHVPASWRGTSMLDDVLIPERCTVVYGTSPEPVLTLAASNRRFTAEAANGMELAVTANVSWTAQSSASWLTVDTVSGNGNGTIIYNVSANTGTGVRTGSITVGEGGLTRTFTVTQDRPESQVTTFKGNGGTPATQMTTNTIYGRYGTFPVVQWSGHVFTGWFTAQEGGTRVYTNSTVTLAATRTLWAHWTDKQVTTFDGNGGTPTSQKTTNTIAAAFGTLPTARWSGHAFLGWYTKEEGGTRISTNTPVKAVASRTFYAHWTTNQVVTFKGNGGSPKSQKTTNTIATAFGTLPTAQWAGHAFLGWYTKEEGGTRISTNTPVKAVASRTFYAHWTTNQVVTFKGNGGSPKSQKTTNTIATAFGTLPTAQRVRHAFLGWYTKEEGGTRISTNTLVKAVASRTFYAHWTTNQVVTFKGNGGSPKSQKTTNTIGTVFGTLPDVAWSNHVFLGWYTEAEGRARITTNSTVKTMATRTLWAHWTDKQVTTFDGNGGTPTSQKTTNTIAAAFGTLPTAQWAGHAFLGWYTKEEGGTRISTNTPVKAVASRTFYAHWTTNQVVTFKGNGGSPKSQKTTNTIGTVFGTLPDVAWSNHVFLGWYTEAEGGARITTNSTVKTMASRTFYAHWSVAKAATGFLISGMLLDDGPDGVWTARTARAPEAPGRVCTIRFEAAAGTEYEIQWTPSLMGEWRSVAYGTTLDEGATEVEIDLPADAPNGFFRVLQPPSE